MRRARFDELIRLHRSMILQVPSGYMAERHGNIQHFLDTFAAQRRYLSGYLVGVQAFSGDDNFEVGTSFA